MSLIVIVTGLAGFLFSFALLNAGVSSMALRYPLAATLAYGVFLAQLRLWLAFVRRRTEPEFDVDPVDLLDVAMNIGSGGRPSPRTPSTRPCDAEDPAASDSADVDTPDLSHLDIPDADLDEAALVAIPLALALAGFLAAFSVVYFAPVLFAELILDAIIVARLYRRFRHLAPEGWLPVAFRQTFRAFAALVVTLALLGLAADALSPTADSIGDFFRSTRQ